MSKDKCDQPIHPFKVGDEVRCYGGDGNSIGTVVQACADSNLLKVKWSHLKSEASDIHHTYLYPADDPHGHLRRFPGRDSRTEALLADFDAAKTRIAELEQACRYEADLCEQALDSRKHAEARITGLEAALIKESARAADAVQRADHFERRLGDANGLGKAARDGLAQAVTRIAELEARIAQIEKNAGRYQWLRDATEFLFCVTDATGRDAQSKEEADAAIDAAMAKGGVMSNQVDVIQQPNNPQTLKWFCFHQNNSGGYFIRDGLVCEYVLFQAPDRESAEANAFSIFQSAGRDSYCSCCGERWYSCDDGTDEPLIYDESVFTMKASWSREQCILHYADGRIERVTFAKDAP